MARSVERLGQSFNQSEEFRLHSDLAEHKRELAQEVDQEELLSALRNSSFSRTSY